MSRSGIILLIAALPASAALRAAENPPSLPDGAGMHGIARPFLKEHCLRCHGPAKTKGDLRLDQLGDDLADPATFERWSEIVARVQSGEMPPKKEPRPRPEQVADVVKQLSARLDEVVAKPSPEGRVVLLQRARGDLGLYVSEVAGIEMIDEEAAESLTERQGAAIAEMPRPEGPLKLVDPELLQRAIDTLVEMPAPR